MLPAGPLPVILSCHQEPATRFFCPFGESGIHRSQAIIGQMRNVGTKRQQFCIGRHNMVRSDIILHFQQHRTLHKPFQFPIQRKGLDIGAAYHRYGIRILRRRNDPVIVHPEIFGHGNHRRLPALAGVRQHTSQGGHGCSFRADEIYAGADRSASSVEVAVERPQGYGIGCRSLPHSNAGTACGFQNPCSGINQIRQCTVFRQHGIHLLGTRGNHQTDIGMDSLSP